MITPGGQVGVKVDIVGFFYHLNTVNRFETYTVYQTRNCFCLFVCQQRVNYNFEDAF